MEAWKWEKMDPEFGDKPLPLIFQGLQTSIVPWELWEKKTYQRIFQEVIGSKVIGSVGYNPDIPHVL